jgi:hypothetical protein
MRKSTDTARIDKRDTIISVILSDYLHGIIPVKFKSKVAPIRSNVPLTPHLSITFGNAVSPMLKHWCRALRRENKGISLFMVKIGHLPGLSCAHEIDPRPKTQSLRT